MSVGNNEDLTCYACGKAATDGYTTTRCLFGVLCYDCKEIARKGSKPVKIKRVSGVDGNGKVKYYYQTLRAFH